MAANLSVGLSVVPHLGVQHLRSPIVFNRCMIPMLEERALLQCLTLRLPPRNAFTAPKGHGQAFRGLVVL